MFCVCACIVITYMATHSKNMNQPGKAANPARGQRNRENEYFPVRVRAREFGLTRRVRQFRPASACSSLYSGIIARVWINRVRLQSCLWSTKHGK